MRKYLLVIATLVAGLSSIAQISYEDFQKYYKPHNDTSLSEGGPTREEVNEYANMEAKDLSNALCSLKNSGVKEDRSLAVELMACMPREKMAAAVHSSDKKCGLGLLDMFNGDWQLELIYYINQFAYELAAPTLSGPREYRPDGDYTLLRDSYTGLSKTVNSKYTEIDPKISPDGKTLFFSRQYHPQNNYGTYSSQDIWMANVEDGIENGKAIYLTPPFNQRKMNALGGISPDGKTVYINGRFKNGEYEGLGMTMLKKTINGFEEGDNFEIIDLGEVSKGKYFGMSICSDLKTLLLYATPEKGSGMTNIYVSFKENDSTFSKPLSLGSTINHDDSQQSTPFLAADGKTLYYGSNHDGYGNSDIFVTKKLDDTWTKWSEPKNMGDKINTEGFDAYYSIDAKGEFAYMVRQVGEDTKEDIIKLPIEKELQPDPVVLISGKVFNAKTKKPIAAEIEYVGLEDGVQYGSTYSDPNDGSYLIILPYGRNYSFNAKSANFIAISDNINLETEGEYDVIERDLSLVPIEVGSKVRMNNIFFDLNKSTLQSTSYVELKKMAQLFKTNPTMVIEISGHSDNTGKSAYNLTLSQKRALSVYNYLAEQGVSKGQLKSKGMGDSSPVASNDTEKGRAENRRVEFEILKK